MVQQQSGFTKGKSPQFEPVFERKAILNGSIAIESFHKKRFLKKKPRLESKFRVIANFYVSLQ